MMDLRAKVIELVGEGYEVKHPAEFATLLSDLEENSEDRIGVAHLIGRAMLKASAGGCRDRCPRWTPIRLEADHSLMIAPDECGVDRAVSIIEQRGRWVLWWEHGPVEAVRVEQAFKLPDTPYQDTPVHYFPCPDIDRLLGILKAAGYTTDKVTTITDALRKNSIAQRENAVYWKHKYYELLASTKE